MGRPGPSIGFCIGAVGRCMFWGPRQVTVACRIAHLRWCLVGCLRGVRPGDRGVGRVSRVGRVRGVSFRPRQRAGKDIPDRIFVFGQVRAGFVVWLGCLRALVLGLTRNRVRPMPAWRCYCLDHRVTLGARVRCRLLWRCGLGRRGLKARPVGPGPVSDFAEIGPVRTCAHGSHVSRGRVPGVIGLLRRTLRFSAAQPRRRQATGGPGRGRRRHRIIQGLGTFRIGGPVRRRRIAQAFGTRFAFGNRHKFNLPGVAQGGRPQRNRPRIAVQARIDRVGAVFQPGKLTVQPLDAPHPVFRNRGRRIVVHPDQRHPNIAQPGHQVVGQKTLKLLANVILHRRPLIVADLPRSQV